MSLVYLSNCEQYLCPTPTAFLRPKVSTIWRISCAYEYQSTIFFHCKYELGRGVLTMKKKTSIFLTVTLRTKNNTSEPSSQSQHAAFSFLSPAKSHYLQCFSRTSLLRTALSPWFLQSKAYISLSAQGGLSRLMTGSQISLWNPFACVKIMGGVAFAEEGRGVVRR